MLSPVHPWPPFRRPPDLICEGRWHFPSFAIHILTKLFSDACRYGTGTECDSACTGTIAPQTYSSTVITLASADPKFGSTLALSGGATYSGLTSSKDSTVWSIETINVCSSSL
jgi:hypothetical protein